jgi:hypothetical protein
VKGMDGRTLAYHDTSRLKDGRIKMEKCVHRAWMPPLPAKADGTEKGDKIPN